MATPIAPSLDAYPPTQPHLAPTAGPAPSLITLNKVPMLDAGQDRSREQAQGDASRELNPSLQEHHSAMIEDGVGQSGLIDNNSSLLSIGDNQSMLLSRLEVDMSVEFNRYFAECASSIRQFQAYKDRFVAQANHKVKKLISRGEVEVSDQSEQLNLKEREEERARKAQAKRRLVEAQKEEIIRKLKTIQQQEAELVHRSVKEGRHRSVEMKKVAYTAQEKQRVAQLLRAQQNFERGLLQKTDDYIKNSQELKRLQEDQLRKAQQAENTRKKQEIAKRLKQMEVKSEERKQILKNSAIKVPHKYVHKQLEKKYNSLQKLSMEQTQKKLKEISIKHKLNIEQINQHDRKYTQLLEKRSQSLTQIKTDSLSSPKRYQPTYFGKIIDEELFEIKERNIERLMKIKENQYKTKISKYQDKINQEHKPKVDPAKSITIVSRTYSSVSLTKQEQTQKGLQYLALAKELKRSSSEVTEPPKQAQNYGYRAYKDYLKERQSSNVDATQKELKEIMAKKDQKDYRSLLRAKFLAEGLEAKSKKSMDDKQYFSAKTKLSLLAQLY